MILFSQMKTLLFSLLAFVSLSVSAGIVAPEPEPEPKLLFSTYSLGIIGDDKSIFDLQMQEALDHYHRTGDALYASPGFRITPLHAAAAAHQLALVQVLLAKGADPNARLHFPSDRGGEEGRAGEGGCFPADTPLMLALRNISVQLARRGDMYVPHADRAGDVAPVVQALLAAGADPCLPGQGGEGALALCAEGCGCRSADDEDGTNVKNARWEDIAITLIDKGAGGSLKDAAVCFDAGWPRAFARLLDSPQGRSLQGSTELQDAWKEAVMEQGLHYDVFSPELQACGRALKPAPGWLDRPLPSGIRLLPIMASLLDDSDGNERALIAPWPAYVELLVLLLEGGADAHLPLSDDCPACAADYLACAPALRAELAQRGFDLAPPPHRFTPDHAVATLGGIPTAAISDAEVRAHRSILEGIVLAPTKETNAKGRALALLFRDNSARARELFCGMPFWHSAESWGCRHQDSPRIYVSIASLTWAPKVVLPPRWLADTARFAVSLPPGETEAGSMHWSRYWQPQVQAYELIRLLERDRSAEADAVLGELCAEPTPLALRAAAWSARLRREGLPDLRDSELSAWLGISPADFKPGETADELLLLRRADIAAHIISPEPLSRRVASCGDRVARDAPAITQALQQLGAHRATAVFGELLAQGASLGNGLSFKEKMPEGLNAREQRTEALLELELAYSQYLWQHRELLRAVFPPLRGLECEQAATLERELRDALAHYRCTGDARYATPAHRVTALHAAALLHDTGLVEELLARGADPDARLQLVLWYRGDEEAAPHAADTPLTLALRHPASAADAQALCHIVGRLGSTGADFRLPGFRDWGALTCFLDGFENLVRQEEDDAGTPRQRQSVSPWETLAGALIGMGAPADVDDALGLMDWGLPLSYCKLMEGPQGEPLRGHPLLREHLDEHHRNGSYPPELLQAMRRATERPGETH